MSDSPPTHSEAQLRLARVYDGRDHTGRPIITRPPLSPELRDPGSAAGESSRT
jgi:hypothetical protein